MPITIAQAKKLKNGQIVYTPGFYNADGSAQRWKVSGMPKTFKDPDRVKVPIKHGMYEHWHIDETNIQGFALKEPKPQTKTQRKKSAEDRKKPRTPRPYYPQYGLV